MNQWGFTAIGFRTTCFPNVIGARIHRLLRDRTEGKKEGEENRAKEETQLTFTAQLWPKPVA